MQPSSSRKMLLFCAASAAAAVLQLFISFQEIIESLGRAIASRPILLLLLLLPLPIRPRTRYKNSIEKKFNGFIQSMMKIMISFGCKLTRACEPLQSD